LVKQRTGTNEPIVKSSDPKPKTEGISQESSSGKPVTDENAALYASIISTADQSFTNKEYNVSRAWYYKALEIKPQESYPQGRIAEINQLLGNMQLSQMDREFQQYIDKGDETFRSEQMAVSRSWYNKALGIKPNDKYPKSQLVEIQMKINEKLQGNTDKTFNDYIAQGNKSFDLKQYNIARIWFQRALQIKPNDKLPREKLEAATKALSGE
jgi:tetratricopeptide (TPR) repeat protein